MTLVQLGLLEPAAKVGQWFERLWAAQPDPAAELYHVWAAEGGLRTSCAPGEEVPAPRLFPGTFVPLVLFPV